MEAQGTLHSLLKHIIAFAADAAGFAALSLCKGWDGRGAYLVGSRDGSGFARLVDLDTIPSSVALDSEGCLWVAQGRAIAQLTATGAATGKHFIVPESHCGYGGTASALQFIQDRMLIFIGTSNSTMYVYDTKSQSCSQLAQHVSPEHGLAVIPNNEGMRVKVLFISKSGSLCQLDLASNEVKLPVLLLRGGGAGAAEVRPGGHWKHAGSQQGRRRAVLPATPRYEGATQAGLPALPSGVG
ncbi:hypothetical protein HaLaN_26553 [Haematococcus lacustris]|uniref:Uncharacterized protein n=1 Tax=Haematococcus lacustris TaxID=44745 RepID=A0A6A0A6G1_HAELA|nr:hypothetical protein HaLaN_26553 [Haematococcus lacustris]